MSTHTGELSPFFGGDLAAGLGNGKETPAVGRSSLLRLGKRRLALVSVFLIALGFAAPAVAQIPNVEPSRRWGVFGSQFQGPHGVPTDTLAEEYRKSMSASGGGQNGNRLGWGLHLPEPVSRKQGHEGGSVSVAELRNPLTGEARKQIQTAQGLLNEGKREEAIELLEAALEIPGARPYALSMLGAQYLHLGAVSVAAHTLKMAVDALPGHAANHSNLAYALGLSGNLEAAVGHARKAVQLDPSRATARYVLGWVLLYQGETEESLHHLRLAAAEIPSAKGLIRTVEEQFSGIPE